MKKPLTILDRVIAAQRSCDNGDFHAHAGKAIRFGFSSAHEAAHWVATHLGPCPPNGSLARIDTYADYAPGNLRWTVRETAKPPRDPASSDQPAALIDPEAKADAVRTARRRSAKRYHAYLQSEAWNIRRTFALEAAGYSCQLCASTKMLEVHHRSYIRIYEERLADLTVLCCDCHGKFHEVLPQPPFIALPATPARALSASPTEPA